MAEYPRKEGVSEISVHVYVHHCCITWRYSRMGVLDYTLPSEREHEKGAREKIPLKAILSDPLSPLRLLLLCAPIVL